MPKIYEYLGIAFIIYTNDHEPVHFHVRYGATEMKVVFELENGQIVSWKFEEIKGKNPLPAAQMREARKFVEVYKYALLQAWIQVQVLKSPVQTIVLTKRVKIPKDS